jgi:DNA repair protein RecN (Recombination protein N)
LLTKLSIQNYALIDDVNVSFTSGLTTITGETGAGKSILLGGLGLILGNRADSNALLNPDKKCVIEGEFDISKYQLETFFQENDLDYEAVSVIRRELLPGGKSRAFVNDTPVRLEVLSDLQTRLIDVHSQHQTLLLNETSFQFEVIDALAETKNEVLEFRKLKQAFEQSVREYEELKEQIRQESIQHEYHFHLYQELQLTDIKVGELESLETEQERLSHMELIQLSLLESYKLLSEEDFGVISRLHLVRNHLDKIKSFSKNYEELFNRVQSTYIELADLNRDLADWVEKEQYAPDELEHINARIQIIYNLMQKHHVQSDVELIEVYNDLAQKVKRVNESDAVLKEKQREYQDLQIKLVEKGMHLHQKRLAILSQFESEVTSILRNLGMLEASFKVQLDSIDKFNAYGMDTLQWLFSANKGNALGLVKQVASGGEMSRIMLAVKSVLAKKAHLPTIIFDEIDTGVSGEVAVKMGEIMKTMAQDMQVICITHLPQIASKGEIQLKVFKETALNKTQTQIKKLTENERLHEIAEMLGGKQLSETAINHAAELLQFKK